VTGGHSFAAAVTLERKPAHALRKQHSSDCSSVALLVGRRIPYLEKRCAGSSPLARRPVARLNCSHRSFFENIALSLDTARKTKYLTFVRKKVKVRISR